MRSARNGPTSPTSTRSPVTQPLERAQLVLRRAVRLSGPDDDDNDRFLVVLDLLRSAHHDPTTMLHALTLGRAQLHAAPDDAATRAAVRLLSRSITWLGRRPEEGEVGTRSPTGD